MLSGSDKLEYARPSGDFVTWKKSRQKEEARKSTLRITRRRKGKPHQFRIADQMRLVFVMALAMVLVKYLGITSVGLVSGAVSACHLGNVCQWQENSTLLATFFGAALGAIVGLVFDVLFGTFPNYRECPV